MSPIPSSFFQPITYDYPKTDILSLPCKKSHGLYSSPTKLLKCWIGIIALVLSELFIISISLGRDKIQNWNCPKVCLFLNLITRRTQIIIDLCLHCQTSTEYLKGLFILEWWNTLRNTIQLSLPSVAFAKDILLNMLYKTSLMQSRPIWIKVYTLVECLLTLIKLLTPLIAIFYFG